MSIVAIIIGVGIIVLIGLITFLISSSDDDMKTGVYLGVSVAILCILEINIVNDIIEEPKPTPMDVYQGKTTLEYTIIDGVKIDSIVVFKEIYKKDYD